MLALHTCVLIDLIKLNKDRTVLIIQPLFLTQISLVKLVEPNRHLLLPIDGQREQHFLSALAVHTHRSVDIIFLIKPNNCELEMREDVLFFDLHFSSPLLLVIFKLEGTVRTDDRVIVILIDVFKVKHLSVLQVFQAVPCD